MKIKLSKNQIETLLWLVKELLSLLLNIRRESKKNKKEEEAEASSSEVADYLGILPMGKEEENEK